MLNNSTTDIVSKRFRANPNYTLIAFQDLPLEQQQQLESLKQDPSFYGLLYPATPNNSLGIKSVCSQTAELYQQLQTPDYLPNNLLTDLGQQANGAISQLVLDSILEIEDGTSGFCSGLQAHGLVGTDAQTTHEPSTKVAQLSQQALRYGQSLNLQDYHTLSARLYAYNRVPASRKWHQRLPHQAAVLNYLGLQPGTELSLCLEQYWIHHGKQPQNSGEQSQEAWLMWSYRGASLQSSGAQKATYKLYISPTCEALPQCFRQIVATLTTLKVPHFKVGRDLYGLLRPDKIVAYFSDYESMARAADALASALADIPAQGVPFTASWDAKGLISWGMDPPESENTLPWSGRESWRLWLTNQLAIALISAQRTSSPSVEPWQFALSRIKLEGIDPATWTPAQSLWA